MDTRTKFGLIYTIEHLRNGVLLSTETAENLAPTEMLEAILSQIFQSGVQQANWYVGLFEGNYTPVPTVKASTISAAATESTAYSETARPAWVGGVIAGSGGAVSNTLSRAVFTITGPKIIYGGFLASSSPKASTLGLLASVVRFPSPKSVDVGDVLRVVAGTTLLSA